MLIACITQEEFRMLEPKTIQELRIQEQIYYNSLKKQGKLYLYYIQAATRGNVLIFNVDTIEEMHRLLMFGPLSMYQKTEVYPLMTLPALGDLPKEMADQKV